MITATELKAFYTGLILSEGSIDEGVRKRSLNIKTINKDFAQYIVSFTQQYTNFATKNKYHPARVSPDGVSHKEYWAVTIGACPYFAKIYHDFYDDYRIKRLTTKSLRWMCTTQAWANFYMSDGYICNVGKTKGLVYNCRVDLCTDNFAKTDVERLSYQLSKMYNYKTSLIRRKTNNGVMWRIRIAKYNAQDFFIRINPYIVPSMKYKLVMGLSETPSWFTDEYKMLLTEINSASTPTDNAVGQDIV